MTLTPIGPPKPYIVRSCNPPPGLLAQNNSGEHSFQGYSAQERVTIVPYVGVQARGGDSADYNNYNNEGEQPEYDAKSDSDDGQIRERRRESSDSGSEAGTLNGDSFVAPAELHNEIMN